ncbi:MAG: LamG domain-containing protein [Candidatus Aminicenantes bacterium]|nr:LamG domain-containing protein [Candidatus Aminicenantes bacterium]
MKKHLEISIVLFILMGLLPLSAQSPEVHWDFEKIQKGRVLEKIKNRWDLLEGNYSEAPGIKGKGLRLDGFTAALRAQETKTPAPGKELTVELWLALGEYPWNWCPALTTERDDVGGYRLQIGPYGQVSMEVNIDEQWRSATSARETVPLRTWMHLVGTYRANEMIEIYVNGERKAFSEIKGEMKGQIGNFLLGLVASPRKPSDIHRTFGTLPDYYGLEGIIDEVKVYPEALTPEKIKNIFIQHETRLPDIQPRRLPTINDIPKRFGAYYTTLKYYPGWDNLWPVGDEADVVVTFDRSPVKLVFWRGTRYSPAWVSENELWMADQSVEAWNNEEGCFEHMQDRHCRFSHVRIIENTEARVVVHWRYAPVSVNENTWRRDPKTGWECWVDEYYYIYPDQTAIRKVSWKTGSLEFPRQFQESEVLLHPGQMISEVVEKDFASVADYNGRTKKVSFVEDPARAPYGPFNWDKFYGYTLQQFNFKSKNKPFICFEPDNKMWLRYENIKNYEGVRGCNHWPVGQARCDGRTTIVTDRPSHTIGFPISEPVVHENGGREFWFGLYGMNGMELKDLVRFGRSWAFPAELTVKEGNLKSAGYEKSERCYKIENLSATPVPVSFILAGSKKSPVINPAIYIKNWKSTSAKVIVDGQENRDCRIDTKKTLEGIDLIIFLPIEKESKTEVRVIPVF